MKIVFFSPYAFIGVHSYPETIVAINLIKRGHDVIFVRCDGLYKEFCIAMSSEGLNPDSDENAKEAVCEQCRIRRDAINKRFCLKSVKLEDYVDQRVISDVEEDLATVTPENWHQLEFDGIPVPRYASYEYFLNNKINSLTFDPALWDGFLVHVRHALLTARIGKIIIDRFMPDAVITYNSVYSCNHVMCAAAEAADISHFTLHAGSHLRHRLSQMTIFKGLIPPYLINRSDAWLDVSDLPLDAEGVEDVFEHVSELIEARSPWVYSVKGARKSDEDLRAYFNIAQGKRVLVVAMASGDERFTADLVDALPTYRPPIFRSQTEWIEKLVDWAQHQDDLVVVIRVHPREFPNKRESITSQQALALRELFRNIPENVRINWPEDQISIHEIIKIADLGLNATSTSGLEMLLFGVPVIIYDHEQLFSYPRELNFVASSQQDYFDKIRLGLNEGKSMRHIVGAFRWLAYKSKVVGIDISDMYGDHFVYRDGSAKAVLKDKVNRFRARALGQFDIDPRLRPWPIWQVKNSELLAHAIENDCESHIQHQAQMLAARPRQSVEAETTMVARAAAVYFDMVGADKSVLAQALRAAEGRGN